MATVVDPIRGDYFHRPRLGHPMAEHRANRRPAEDDEADRRRDRVAWEPEQRSMPDVPECQWLPRFHADLPDGNLAFGLQHILHQVVITERHASRSRYEERRVGKECGTRW